MPDADDLIAEARRRLHARFEAAVANADQRLAGLVSPAVVAAWEQWKAAERARRRLESPGIDGIDLSGTADRRG